MNIDGNQQKQQFETNVNRLIAQSSKLWVICLLTLVIAGCATINIIDSPTTPTVNLVPISNVTIFSSPLSLPIAQFVNQDFSFPPTPTPTHQPFPTLAPGVTPTPTSPYSCGGNSSISGHVIFPDGQPAANAIVEMVWTRPGPNCGNIIANLNGEFTFSQLQAGTYSFRVNPPIPSAGIEPPELYASPQFSVTVDGSNPISFSEPIRLTGRQVMGRILLMDGRPGTNVVVGIFAAKLNEDPCKPESDPIIALGGVMENDGTFRAGGLPNNGIYCAQLMTSWDQQIVASIPFTLSGVDETIDLGLQTVPIPIKRINGSVLDQHGDPVSASILAVRREGQAYPGHYFTTRTDNGGMFAFDVSAGVWELTSWPFGKEWHPFEPYSAEMKKTVEFAADQTQETQEMKFVLAKPAALTGRILGSDGHLFTADELGILFAVVANNTQKISFSTPLDDHGFFTFSVPTGVLEFGISIYETLGQFPSTYPDHFAPAPRSITIEADEVVNLGDIRLAAPQVIARIVNPWGNPLSSTYVLVYPREGSTRCKTFAAFPMPTPSPPHGLPTGGSAPTPVFTSPFHSDKYTMSDIDGIIRFGGLTKGDYCLHSSLPISATFHLANENGTLDLGTFIPIVPSKRVSGKVIDEYGRGVADQQIVFNRPGRTDEIFNAMTDIQGSFIIDLYGGDWDMILILSPTNQPGNVREEGDIIKKLSFVNDQTVEEKAVEFTVYRVELPIVNR